MKKDSLIFIISFVIFNSCTKNDLSIQDYIEYIRNDKNELIKKIVKNNYQFKVQYQPPEYLTLSELRGEPINKPKFDKEIKKFKDYFYLDFSIQSLDDKKPILDKSDSSDFEQRLNHLSFGLTSSVFLIQGIDTLKCLLYEFDNSGNISPEYHFQMMFNHPNFSKQSELRFIYTDTLLQTGIVSIPISLKGIINIPQIKI